MLGFILPSQVFDRGLTNPQPNNLSKRAVTGLKQTVSPQFQNERRDTITPDGLAALEAGQ